MSEALADRPRLYIEFGGRMTNESPVAMALKKVAFGSQDVDELVDDSDVEADIAITNDAGIALTMVKETEATTIVVVHLTREEREEADAFAARYPERVKSVPYVGGKQEIVPFLLALIAEKARKE